MLQLLRLKMIQTMTDKIIETGTWTGSGSAESQAELPIGSALGSASAEGCS